MDRISKEQRSRNMSHIRSSDTSPEVFIRKLLWKKGLRYRKNYTGIKGKPDMYFSKYRVAVFIHGCYWHRHQGCKNATTPRTNTEFWEKKFSDNMHRDAIVREKLSAAGIRVIVVWECSVEKAMKDKDEQITLINALCFEIRESLSPYIEF